MKKILISAAIAIAVITAGILIVKAQKRGNDTIGEKEVQAALSIYAKLATEENLRQMKLKSGAEITALKVAYQFERNMIQLDELRKYQMGTDPATLIKKLDATDVVLADAQGNWTTSVQFTKGKEGAEASGFGYTPAMSALAGAASIIGPENLRQARIVDIPALHTSFAVLEEQGKLIFIPTANDEQAGFKAGDRIPAEKALAVLVPIATAYNGLPQ
ncbi:MAG: hypothetical protein JNL57_00730 [Bacteroidetes bacterium]|nr:hypothetical protein [Bacteroidota bacterium]